MPTRILVVDDEPDLALMISQKFRRQVRENELAFVFASNGVEALRQLQEDSAIEIVLTDINMPEMDGLELLAKITERHPLLKTVIVSAYGDMKNIRTALNHGAFDFVTKPIDFDDLEITIKKTIVEANLLKKAALEHDQLVALQRELDVAKSIQQTIVPQSFPPFPGRKEFQLYAEMIPAREVGGDFYDFFLIDDRNVGFVIGDVSGKSVPAALFMAVSKTVLKATAMKGLPPHECLQQVNRILFMESVDEMFVTVFYGILNTATGEVAFCNGGHNRPYVMRPGGGVDMLEGKDGLMLGLLENWDYQVSQISLAPGEGLLLYTDGVTEAMNHEREQFGDERMAAALRKLVEAPLTEIVTGLIHDVNAFVDGALPADDLTILTLRFTG